MRRQFHHEQLEVYQAAISFVAWAHDLVADHGLDGPLLGQLTRASASIPLNIAEGNGRYSGRDRRHFLEIARGSALECAACLDVFAARRRVTAPQIDPGKDLLDRVVAMLSVMVRSLPKRIAEPDGIYDTHKGEGFEPEPECEPEPDVHPE